MLFLLPIIQGTIGSPDGLATGKDNVFTEKESYDVDTIHDHSADLAGA